MATPDRYGGLWTRAELEDLARQAELDNQIPPGGLVALIGAESAWDPNAESPAGAQGLAQFMPPTSAEWEIDAWDPPDAISGAARYLRWLRSKMPSWSATLAAYNYGIGNVTRHLDQNGGLEVSKLPAETRAYVAKLAPAFGEPSPSSSPALASLALPILALAVLMVWRTT